jgi:hypothetical protein
MDHLIARTNPIPKKCFGSPSPCEQAPVFKYTQHSRFYARDSFKTETLYYCRRCFVDTVLWRINRLYTSCVVPKVEFEYVGEIEINEGCIDGPAPARPEKRKEAEPNGEPLYAEGQK